MSVEYSLLHILFVEGKGLTAGTQPGKKEVCSKDLVKGHAVSLKGLDAAPQMPKPASDLLPTSENGSLLFSMFKFWQSNGVGISS